MSTSQEQPSTSSTPLPLPQPPSMSSIYSTKFPSNAVEILNFKKNLPSQNEMIKIVEIKNCTTTLDASKLITNSVFRSILESLENFIIIKLRIDEKLDEKHAEKPKIHEFKIERNFLISYESNKALNEKIIYWKNGEEFKTIKLLEGYSVEMTNFVRFFLIDTVDENFKDSKIELTNLIDSNGFNLLMKAVIDRKLLTLIDELLHLPFDINQKCNKGRSAADIAWDRRYFAILLKLLEANSKFPKMYYDELGDIDASKKIIEFIETCCSMHTAIKDNNFKNIQDLIKENQNLKYFYNVKNVSAAMTAIKTKKFKIYKNLLENGCSTGPDEYLNQHINQIYENKETNEPRIVALKSVITSAHDDASIELPEKHLNILYANSFISHDDQLAKQRSMLIKEVYNNLNSFQITRQILKLISMHKNFKIHFDFNRSSIEFMNPSGGDRTTRGLFENYDGIEMANIYIAGDDKHAALGTVAHELCHFAMNLTFCNDAKPYAIDDEENKEKFNEIIKTCKGLMEIEKKVSLVFTNYDEDLWPAELIVRVPHMIVHYQNNSTRLDELKVTFKDLFDYYNDVVVSKINETLMKMIGKLFNNSFEIEFNDLTDAYKAKIHHSNVDFQGVRMKFFKIIEIKNSDIFELLNSKQIREILIENVSLSIGHAEEIKTKFYSERNFIDHITRLPKDFDKPKKYVRPYEASNDLFTFDKISSIADDTKMILLSDHAGNGKTTTFKHLSGKLKSKFPNFWISYIDLKKHLRVYEKFEQNFIENQVLGALQEILSITDKLEVEIFTKLFNCNRVILLYDGVDEIAPKFKDFFIKLIKSVKNATHNQQWIATRPQHTQELKEKFKQNAYMLLPYDDDKKIEFIENVLENLKVENIKAQNVLRDINKMTSYGNNIDSPLMLQMMTELYVNDTTFLENSNKFSLYEKMIEMKKNIIADKDKIVINDCNNPKAKLTVWQVHQIYALKLFLKDGFKDHMNDSKIIDINKFHLLKRWKKEQSKWTPGAISRYGFLIVDRWDTENEFSDFAHRTFAEFFIAQFVVQDLYELDEDDDDIEMSEKEIELRVKLLIEISYTYAISEFILNYIDNHKPKRMHEYFFKIITSKEIQKILVFSESIPNNNILKIFSIDERFLKEFTFDDNKTIFQYFINHISLYDIPKIVDIYKRFFGVDWINHTGYALNENYKNTDKILKHKSNYLHPKLEILSFIDQFALPQNDLLEFFRNNFYTTCVKTLLTSLPKLSRKLIEIIQKNLYNCKSEFLSIVIIKKARYYPLHNNQSNANAKDFIRQLEEFLKLDNTICKDDLKVLILNLNLRFFGIEILVNSYREEKLTKNYIQQFFNKNLAYVIDCIIRTRYEKLVENFITFFKEIFDVQSERNQLKIYLESRFECHDEKFNNHTILSYLSKDENLLKSNAGKGKKFKLFQSNLLEMAKQIEITDDEIEKLSKI